MPAIAFATLLAAGQARVAETSPKARTVGFSAALVPLVVYWGGADRAMGRPGGPSGRAARRQRTAGRRRQVVIGSRRPDELAEAVRTASAQR